MKKKVGQFCPILRVAEGRQGGLPSQPHLDGSIHPDTACKSLLFCLSTSQNIIRLSDLPNKSCFSTFVGLIRKRATTDQRRSETISRLKITPPESGKIGRIHFSGQRKLTENAE